MKDKLKGLMLGLLIGTLLTGGSVFAANKMKIEVTFDSLKYMVDGIQKKPSSGDGFIYNGTTYVPLRFAGEALGKDVSWDGKNKTIWIGKKEGTFKYLSDIEYARAEGNANGGMSINVWDYPSGNDFNIAGTKYLNGIGINTRGDSAGKVSYNLNGNYKKLTALVGIDDYTKNSETIGRVTIIGDDNELYRSNNLIGGNLADEISLDVTGVLKLEIKFESFSSYDYLYLVLAEAKLH